jgi:hypothetical protein
VWLARCRSTFLQSLFAFLIALDVINDLTNFGFANDAYEFFVCLHVPTMSRRTNACLSAIGPNSACWPQCGGVLITEAGNALDVVGFVYIAAFIPDQGEGAVALLSKFSAAT